MNLISLRKLPNSSFWQNKRVLVTGHTGFKGSWLAIWLKHLGAEVTGISLPPATNPSLFELANIELNLSNIFCDITDYHKLQTKIIECQPEIVFHLAAQALVIPSYNEPLDTINTNVLGTANLLEAIRQTNTVRAIVAVTTDKVYLNKPETRPYREDSPLGGHDPYSASKAASELIIDSYRNAFFKKDGVAIAAARAGNVIGGGDWSDERLIPDAIRAWTTSRKLQIRNPLAIRPWQHVLEPLFGYLILAENIYEKPYLSGPFNFGPKQDVIASVKQVIEIAKQEYEASVVSWEEKSSDFHETDFLSLDSTKSLNVLGVEPRWDVNLSVAKTIQWYVNQLNGMNALELCKKQIQDFEGEL